MKLRSSLFALALAALGAGSFSTPAPVRAQQLLDNTLFTAGTVAKNAANQNWAYIAFQIDDAAKLRNRKLAVYVKPGKPDSGAAFARKAVITVQTDPLILQMLINRAANLGEQPAQLNAAIDQIFGDLVPDPSLALPKKLSAVIQGALTRPDQYVSLVLLARTHPAVGLALGLAHAEPIPAGESTFEIREFDTAAVKDLGVMGRVTVTAGQPTVLPAPSAPVHVPDTSAKGHLNARLRWGTPVPLRQLSLMHYGYNIYRVTKTFAEDNDFNITPPQPEELIAMAQQGLGGTRRINYAPILAARVMTETEAPDLTLDAKTAFFNDDNGLEQDNAVPFKDGEQFYFFVTARDLLGRDGLVSKGTLVTMCDRVPPSAPRRPAVENDYQYANGAGTQRLKVSWRQRPQEPDNVIIGYYVYRWAAAGDVSTMGGPTDTNRVSGLIPHINGQEEQTFLDNGNGAPTSPQDNDHTFFYTVRAVEQTCLGHNISPHSAPAAGVLRDRLAPAGPTGGAYVECCDPVSSNDGTEDTRTVDGDKADVILDLVCSRAGKSVAWAEFYIGGTAPGQRQARVLFPQNGDKVRRRVTLRRANVVNGPPVSVFCRTGDFDGKVSGFANATLSGLPGVSERRIVKFKATLRCTEVLFNDAAEAGGCTGHDPHPQGQGGEGTPGNDVHGVKVKIDLKPQTKEWRLYRRIDGGKMSMLRQGVADFANVQQIEIVDTDLPSVSATIYYYGQLLDQNGNASQLVLLGKAVPLKQAPPMPMQAPTSIVGSPGAPRGMVKWFCPPQGVERFEVYVHVAPGTAPEIFSTALGPNHHSPQDMIALGPVDEETTETLPYGAYYTPQIGGAFGNGPEFSFTFPMKKDQTYLIQIASVAKNGGKKTIGNVQRLAWKGGEALSGGPPPPGTPGVPWPEVYPPAPGDAWNPLVAPVRVSDASFQGVGIKIGELASDQVGFTNGVPNVKNHGSLVSALFPSVLPGGEKEKLLPLMLYRYQVPNSLFPQVSNDIIQVSPLMERIALAEKTDGQTNYAEIRDPFVRLFAQSTPAPGWQIVLLDTQPVVKRAAYAYILVRFSKNGEIASVHPTPTITVQ